MKLGYIYLFVIGITLLTFTTKGQEVSLKQLKKEKKSLSTQAFKAMLDEESLLKNEESKLNEKLDQVKQKKDKANKEIETVESNLNDSKKKLDDLNKEFLELSEKNEIVPSREDISKLEKNAPVINNSGVFFRVQLGAYAVLDNAVIGNDFVDLCKTKDVDLTKQKIYINRCLDDYFTNNNQFKYEGSFSRDQNNNFKKYMVGYFADYWEADTFKRLLREMGVHKAWIVPYIDGKRVALKDIIDNHSELIFGKKK